MNNDLDPRTDKKAQDPSKILNREVFYKNQTIIQQGSPSFRAYYIESGLVEISVQEDRHNLKISELGPGEIFGEMGMIGEEPRTASAKALDDTTVTIITQDMLNKKIDAIQDKAVRALFNVLIKRLQEANMGQLHHYRNLADFQDRIAGLVNKADAGIDKASRDAFREEAEPLLKQLEALLDKYRS